MRSLTRLAALAVAMLGCHPAEVQPPAPTSTPTSWGPSSPEGLQLGCWQDGETIRCSIRNDGAAPVRYSDYLLGDPGFVTLRVSVDGGDEWHDLPQPSSTLSAGALAANIHSLAPQQAMPPKRGTGNVAFSVDLHGRAQHGFRVVVIQHFGDDGSKGTWRGDLVSSIVDVK